MKYFILVGLVLNSSAFVKRDTAGTALFQSGKEYVYDYSSASLAGSQDYVSFASAANITGELHIQGGASVLNVQLKNVKLGLYNGELRKNPQPEFEQKTFSQLDPLSEPFAVQVQRGQVKGIVLNRNIPIWAQNMQRGIASALQIDIAQINTSEGSSFQTEEKTVVGECVTEYTVIPGKDREHAHIRKLRSHAQCKNLPKRVQNTGISEQLFPDFNSRSQDPLNSTGFSVYDLELKDGSLALKRINVVSTVVYNLFGTEGHSHYSFGSINAVLKEVKSGSVAGPLNGKESNSLAFVFENDNDEDRRRRTTDELLEYMTNRCRRSLDSVQGFKDLILYFTNPFSELQAVDCSYVKYVEGGNYTAAYQVSFPWIPWLLLETGPTALAIGQLEQLLNKTATRLEAKLALG